MSAVDALPVPFPSLPSGSQPRRSARENAIVALGSGGGAPALDTTPPTFAGLTSATVLSASSIAVAWSNATDAVSDAAHIHYEVFVQRVTYGSIYYGSPQLVTSNGANSAVVSGLSPSTAYHVAVRAVDAAGNKDSNTAVLDRTTSADTVAPTFAGLTHAVLAIADPDPPSVLLTWEVAADDFTTPANIAYDIWRASTEVGINYTDTVFDTVVGETSYLDTTVSVGQMYVYAVRARDQAGNADTNTVQPTVNVTSGGAADTTPPTLSGDPLVAAPSGYQSILVSWTAATDDLSPQDDLVYQIHLARTGEADFDVRKVSPAGAVSVTIDELSPETTYYVRMRVMDTSGNLSAETEEVVVRMPAQSTDKPTYTNRYPPPGTSIGRRDFLTFDVQQGAAPLRRVIVTVLIGGVEEVVHDGDGFRPYYAALSTRDTISGGFRYMIARMGGWIGQPTVRVFATDRAGSELS